MLLTSLLPKGIVSSAYIKLKYKNDCHRSIDILDGACKIEDTQFMNTDPHIKKTEQKALEINLDPRIYGTFAEIGAGQEVARNFFQVGAAAGTIAKTMSAYDKIYSDQIYGVEESGRYVCESRVYTMLDHEYNLLDERLSTCRLDTTFFVFADTVAAINYQKTIKGNGWLGIRFQLNPCTDPNDLIVHVKMLDNDNKLQQEAIGVIGVNMLYACYNYADNIEKFVVSLMDGLAGRISIDMIRLNGPEFDHFDDRLLSLYLVKSGLTDVAIFGSDKRALHASEFLYKNSVMVVRGNFRPPTLVTNDVIKTGFEQFVQEEHVEAEKCFILTELTLDNLMRHNVLDEQDFLDRTESLCALGHTVIISNCSNHQMLINYLKDYKIKRLGLIIGAHELLEIINEKYYNNSDGRLLVAFGELFTRNIKIYVYPAKQEDDGGLLRAANLPVPAGIKFLYQHLLDSRQIEEIEGYNADLLHIYPYKVYGKIQEGSDQWKTMVPDKLVEVIKDKKLFGLASKVTSNTPS